MSGYGAGYGDAGVTGYEDASALGAVTGYGTAAGEARLVTWCTVLDVHAMFPFVKTALYTSGIVSSYWYCHIACGARFCVTVQCLSICLCIRLSVQAWAHSSKPAASQQQSRCCRFAAVGTGCYVLFFTVLDPRVGHTMDVLSLFIPVLCH